MDIKHAKSVLVIGFPGCNALEVIRDLTGTAPLQGDATSLAGLTHQWVVQTKYYNASIPIWVDEVADIEQWKSDFSKPEAKEVVEAVGAWLVCLNITKEQDEQNTRLLQAVQEVVEQHGESSTDAIMLAMGTSTAPGTALSPNAQAEWEDIAMDHGFELIDCNGNGHNEYGERQGMHRAKEALTAHEWSMPSTDAGSEDGRDTPEETDFADLETGGDIASAMRTALMSDQEETEDEVGGDQAAVDDLDAMLGKLLAAKERVADMPEAQRKKAAADAVRRIMNSNV